MISNLSEEVAHFCKQNRNLRRLLEDTLKCFQDINAVKYQNGVDPLRAEFTHSEQQEADDATGQTLALCIAGRSSTAKAFVANQLFEQQILPCDFTRQREVDKQPWRRVDFVYGEYTHFSHCLPGSFELVNEENHLEDAISSVPLLELILPDHEQESSGSWTATVEVRLNHALLLEGARVTVMPTSNKEMSVTTIYHLCTKDTLPVVIYAIAEGVLSEDDAADLKEMKEAFPDMPIFFVKISLPSSPPSQPKARGTPLSNVRDALVRNNINNDCPPLSQANSYPSGVHGSPSLGLFQQILDIGYLSLLPNNGAESSNEDGTGSPGDTDSGYYAVVDSELVESFDSFVNLVPFVHNVVQRRLIQTVTFLNIIHIRCVQSFILKAFDMARDMLITPKRLEFARSKETALYSSLMDIALKKQAEIKEIIRDTVSSMKEGLLQKAENFEFSGVEIEQSGEVRSSSHLKTCTAQIQELVLGELNASIAAKLLNSVDVLRDSYTGVLTRCLESLEQSDANSFESARTSIALKEILTAAYQVEITVRAGSSIVKILIEKMKQILHSMPWHSTPRIDRAWKRRVAADMLDSLSDTRLAKGICSQIKERLKQSHETFSSALKQLEARHSGRLESTEEHRIKVRKVHAPKVARLALESTSFKDFILNGLPVMGKEIGRGQYGVVYSCEKWGSFGPCAVKTVVPPDDKHWNDLALEFYYTKHVPEHPRIAALQGSVIDYSFSGSNAAVLLIMERMQRDLYAAIKAGINWICRLQVAIDVVEGIRYLHSQGLVHRDIKLKNVLLNKQNRACLTDLGFCKPEAMMSGSIVGTPIHMAPELFTGRYDSSVDVYAFGVLFWYISSGNVRLPRTFEQCANKEMLWTSVRRGIRPEHLPQFDPECWDLMQQCWHNDPAKRPLLGHVEPQLARIYNRFSTKLKSSSPLTQPRSEASGLTKASSQRRKPPQAVRPLPVL